MYNITDIMDYKAIIGVLGTGVTLALENVSVSISILVGMVTLVYMSLKVYEKWNEIKKDIN